MEPGLAESWKVSDDGLTYTFKNARGEILRRLANHGR